MLHLGFLYDGKYIELNGYFHYGMEYTSISNTRYSKPQQSILFTPVMFHVLGITVRISGCLSILLVMSEGGIIEVQQFLTGVFTCCKELHIGVDSIPGDP